MYRYVKGLEAEQLGGESVDPGALDRCEPFRYVPLDTSDGRGRRTRPRGDFTFKSQKDFVFRGDSAVWIGGSFFVQ